MVHVDVNMDEGVMTGSCCGDERVVKHKGRKIERSEPNHHSASPHQPPPLPSQFHAQSPYFKLQTTLDSYTCVCCTFAAVCLFVLL
jgi:hypothetical protein